MRQFACFYWYTFKYCALLYSAYFKGSWHEKQDKYTLDPGNSTVQKLIQNSLNPTFEAKAKNFGTRGYRYLLGTSTDGLT